MYIDYRYNYKKGFTIIELIVVISIISLLASIVLSNVNGYMAKARDARRVSDLNRIGVALSLYHSTYDNWIETGSGCGWGGNGQGWFNYTGGSYPKSTVQCLVDTQILGTEIIDPTGGRYSTSTSGYTYMKYHCTQSGKRVVYVYAKLEGRPQSSTATDGTCCSSCDSNYGMNYYLRLE